MKLTIVFLLMLVPLGLLAQDIKGTVVDKESGKPVANATVSTTRLLTSTYSDGVFSLKGIYPGDTLTVKCIGYRPYKLGIGLYIAKTITIYLQPTNILLQSVAIKAKHNPKSDSIRLRKQFAAVFEYKAPTFYDMFAKVDPYLYVPYNYIQSTNGLSTLVTVDVLSVISLLDKNKDHTSKLQKTLLNDEETAYVDRMFSKQKITNLTNLKGDSLLDFMDDYRPSEKQVKKMSDYDMVIYIKNSYAQFIKNYDVIERSPFTK